MENQLRTKRVSAVQRSLLERRLNDIKEWFDPPAFDRPRHSKLSSYRTDPPQTLNTEI